MTVAIQPRTSPPVASLSAPISPSIPHSPSLRPSSFVLSTLYRLLRSSRTIASFVFNTLRTLVYSFIAPIPTVSAPYKLFVPKYGVDEGRQNPNQINALRTLQPGREHAVAPHQPQTRCLFLSLCPLFAIDFLCFQHFLSTLQKTGGWVYPEPFEPNRTLANCSRGLTLPDLANSFIVGVSFPSKMRGVRLCRSKRPTRREKENSRHPVWCRSHRRVHREADAREAGH
jgi:hypothetical protein